MNTKSVLFAIVTCFVIIFTALEVLMAVPNEPSSIAWQSQYSQGSIYYQNKELDKAIVEFKKALGSVFPEPASGKLAEGEKTLRSLFNDEKRMARARYQLGLIYESQQRFEEAAVLFRDCLAILETQGATYLGYLDGCKSCHYKEWKSWKKTKMSKAFEVLKPGINAEKKVELKLDPEKDYTEDPNCLSCHTTGFGMPGGYAIPTGAKYSVRKAAEQTMGGTCETCHGPGSKYGPLHADVDENARPYVPEEFYAVGEYKVDNRVCERCHNRRNPTAGHDYRFDFKELKDKDTHENFPLIYRVQKKK